MTKLIDLTEPSVQKVLTILLQDRTTQRSIIWGNDTYAELGEGYRAEDPIRMSAILSQIIQPRVLKTAHDRNDRTKKHAEVCTPAWICNRMNNHLDTMWFGREDVFNRTEGQEWTITETEISFPKRKRWQRYVDSRRLEITCGEAPYLTSRYDAASGEAIPPEKRIGLLDRKIRVVNERAADEAEWFRYLYRAYESVYGYEYQGDNLLIARINLLMSFIEAVRMKWKREPTYRELKKTATIVSWNLWQMDGLKGIPPHQALYRRGRQTTIFELLGERRQETENDERSCVIRDWRGQSKLKYTNRITRKGSVMKFDFVIGNPPYQDETTGDQKNFAAPVYHMFLNEAIKVSNRVEMIHPARFLFNAGSTPKKWNEKMLNDSHFRVLFYESDSHKVFSNTEIKAGVVISYYDAERECEPIEVFTPYPELNAILRKIKNTSEKSLKEYVLSRTVYRLTEKMHQDFPEAMSCLSEGHRYDMSTNIFERLPFVFYDAKPCDGNQYIQIYGREKNERTFKYIRCEYVNDVKNLYKYKLAMAKANGSGTFGECLAESIVLGPGVGLTESFVSIGFFETVKEAENLKKYVKTKFFRAALGVLKTTQDITPDKFKYVPVQCFTRESEINWDLSIKDIDYQLYRKYGFDENEIDFIETHVKEMV